MRRFLPIAVFSILAVLLSSHFGLILLRNGKIFLDGDAYINYEANRPYQYRLLMAPVLQALIEFFDKPGLSELLTRVSFISTPEEISYLTINVISLLISWFLLAAIARRVAGGRLPTWLVIAVYMGLIYSYFCLNPNLAFLLPYDIPAVVFTQACLLCILTESWALLYPVFSFGVLNRETVFLVVIFLFVYALRNPGLRRRAFRHIVGLSIVFIVIKLGLFLGLGHLDTEQGSRVMYNLRTLAKPWQWPSLTPLLGSFGLAIASLTRVQAGKEWAITGCCGFAIMFWFGQITETRLFGDLTTFFAVAICLWLESFEEPLKSSR